RERARGDALGFSQVRVIFCGCEELDVVFDAEGGEVHERRGADRAGEGAAGVILFFKQAIGSLKGVFLPGVEARGVGQVMGLAGDLVEEQTRASALQRGGGIFKGASCIEINTSATNAIFS